MRPPGEIRRAALAAAWDVAVARASQPVPGATWRDVAAVLVPQGVATRVARDTWKNMVRSGALRPVGTVRVPDSARALQAYAPAGLSPCGQAAPLLDMALGAALRAWVGPR